MGSDVQRSIVTRTDEEMRNKDWSSRDSNRGSSDCQASALPLEPLSRLKKGVYLSQIKPGLPRRPSSKQGRAYSIKDRSELISVEDNI